MKTRLLRSSLLGLLALVAAQLAGAQSPTQRTVRYTVTDLGTLGGPGTNSSAFDNNNAGWVAGSGNLTSDGPQHAFVWYGRGPLIDTGTLGGPNSEADGPNLWGQVPILSETAKLDPNGEDFCSFGNHLQCLGAIWRNRKLYALPTLPGGRNAEVLGINDLGQTVGFSETGVADSTCKSAMPSQLFRYQAAIWEPSGKVRELRPLHGDTVGFAFGINDEGQAVGSSGLCSDTAIPLLQPNGVHALLWERDGTPRDLGSLGGAASHVATSINNAGQVVGTSQFTDGTVHSFFWSRNKGMRDLGTLPGAVLTVAPCCNTLNDRGQVVGFWFDSDFNPSAFVWQNNVITDLNDLLSQDSPWQLLFAQAINDAGEIVGQGLINGELHAFLAIPTAGGNAELDGPRPRVNLSPGERQRLQQQLRHSRLGAWVGRMK